MRISFVFVVAAFAVVCGGVVRTEEPITPPVAEAGTDTVKPAKKEVDPCPFETPKEVESPFGGDNNGQSSEPMIDPFGSGDDPFNGAHLAALPPITKIEIGPLAKGINNPTIRDKLRRRVKMSASGKLDDVLAEFGKHAELKFHIDSPALEDFGIAADAIVEAEITHGLPIDLAIRVLLKSIDADIAYYIKDDLVVVTSLDLANEKLVHRIFDVSDLQKITEAPAIRHVWRNSKSDSHLGAVTDLSETIERTIRLGSWDETGGPCSMRYVTDMLHVNAHADIVEREIPALLESLRQAKAWNGHDTKVLNAFSQAAGSTWQPLEKKITLKLNQEPLGKVFKHLACLAKTEIIIETWALEQIGLATDFPCTIDVKDVKMRTVIELVLRSIDPDLAICPIDGGFVITTRDAAEEYAITRVLPIRDLLEFGYDVKEFTELLEETVEPESWMQVGGRGDIKFFSPSRAFIVTQTAEVHEKLDQALAELREKIARRNASQPVATDTPTERPDGDNSIIGLEDLPGWPIVVYHVEINGPKKITFIQDGENKTVATHGPVSLDSLPDLLRQLMG